MPVADITSRMLETYPRDFNVSRDLLVRCIEACVACEQACTQCADDCLSEENVAELVKCIRLNEDCADICVVGGRVANRQTEYDANVTRAVIEACARVCKSCADECDRHASHHEHRRICAEACRACEEACRDLLEAIA